MNAAFLMLTAAWMTGADPVPASAAPPPAAAPAVVAGTGCGGCGASCNDGCGRQKLCDRLKGMFHRDHCGCENACAPAAPVCAPKPVCCAPPKPVCCAPPKPVCAPAPACAPSCNDGCGRQKLCDRLKGLFQRHNDCGGCDAGCGGCGAAPAPGAPAPGTPDKMPTPAPKPTTIGQNGVIITPARIGIEENKNPFDLRRRYETRVSNSADYSTLTGQLFFVHTDGGRWVLRYAPISKEDRYGGSVVLARDIDMDPFAEGDLVTAKGSILSEKSTFPLGGALYRASKLTLVERGADEPKAE